MLIINTEGSLKNTKNAQDKCVPLFITSGTMSKAYKFRNHDYAMHM